MKTSFSLAIIASLICLAAAPSQAGPRPAGRAALAQQQQQTTPPVQQQPPPETTPAAGRGAAPAGNPQQRPAVDMEKMQTVQQMLDGLEINQADRALQLTDKQYGEFIQRLRNLQRLRHQHQTQRQRLVGELRRMANSNPPVEDALLEEPTKKLDDFDKQAFQEMQTAYAQIDEVLDVRQRARFRLFEEQLEQRKLEILSRVLKAGAPAPDKPAAKTIK